MSKRSPSVFFFQAEDGIRDYKVTGVQTCALPISAVAAQDRGRLAVVAVGNDDDLQVRRRVIERAERSEERRVGKEGSGGGGRDAGKESKERRRERGTRGGGQDVGGRAGQKGEGGQ